MNQHKPPQTNITFIGSGISSTFTLIYFLQHLEKEYLGDTIYINVADKYSEFFTGIPYGKRSGSSVLLITSLKNFLPEPERILFIDWLNQHKDQLIKEMLNEGGDLSLKWIKKHANQIKNENWEDLFIPRWFFGRYITEKVENLIQKLEEKKIVHINFITAEIVNIEKAINNFELITKDQKFITEKIVLGIGSLPTKRIYTYASKINKENLLLINDNYTPNLNDNLKEIQDFTYKREAENKKTNVLIIGANASALELLYKLNDTKHDSMNINHSTFISTHGLLPDAVIDQKRLSEFVPIHLHQLKEKEVITAKDIANATYKDLDDAEKISLGAATTVTIISSAFGELLHKLSKEELKSFACKYGNEIGRRQRCAGEHYTEVVEELKSKNKFNHLAGKFKTLQKENNNEYYLEYNETETNSNKLSKIPYHIVINCMGSTSFIANDVPELLQNLVKKEYCSPNSSQIGIDVNNNLESISNLHIVGPLLAGNIIQNRAVWHVEHCGRITWLSRILADKLYQHYKLKRSSIKLI